AGKSESSGFESQRGDRVCGVLLHGTFLRVPAGQPGSEPAAGRIVEIRIKDGNRGQATVGIGMEGDSRGGDWRPFLFFGRVSFSKESGNCVDWNSLSFWLQRARGNRAGTRSMKMQLLGRVAGMAALLLLC